MPNTCSSGGNSMSIDTCADSSALGSGAVPAATTESAAPGVQKCETTLFVEIKVYFIPCFSFRALR